MDQSEAGFQTTLGRPPAPSLARLTRSREILHQADSMAVNGPGGMYKLNSIYTTSNDTMPLPTCMYSMKNIHGECVSNVEGDNHVDPALAELEKRQESILSKLYVLKSKVDALAQKSGVTSTKLKESQKCQASCTEVRGTASVVGTALDGLTTIQDLVISANPSSPPLSIAVLYQLLSEQYRVITACHTHSSVPGGVSEKLKHALGNDGLIQSRNTAQLALTLIWKDVSHGPSLMVSPSIQTAIEGEGSVARYLARLLNPAYDSGLIEVVTEIDQLVDLAGQLITGNNKEKAGVVRTLNGRLGKADYLVGEALSLADIVLWSAVHQTKQAHSAPPNVKKWLERCAENPAFELARKML